MKFILYSAPDAVANEPALLGAMLEQGVDVLHVRKPTWQRDAVAALIESIPPQWHNRIVVHTHHELVQQYGLYGIHLPETVRLGNPLYAAQSKHNGVRHVSTSFHLLSALAECDTAYEYVTLSPVFASISKQGYSAAFSAAEMGEAVQRSSYAVIALGGICKENIHKLQAMGFAGAAVLGAVWQSAHPVQECKALMMQLR